MTPDVLDAAARRKRRVLGLAAQIAAVTVLAAGYTMAFVGATYGMFTPMGSPNVPWSPAGLMISLAGLRLYRRARRYRAIQAAAPTVDTRPPVLYLRSFKDDRVAAKLGTNYWAFTTEEEDLAWVLTRIGPCTAVGVPGEKLPEVGVHRVYIQGSDWKAQVQRMMTESRLVVIRAGATDGLFAELEMAVAALPPERVVLLAPKGRKTQSLMTEAFRRMGLGAAPAVPTRAPRGLSISSAIYFDPEWNPRIQAAKVPFFSLFSLKPAVFAYNEALRPAFEAAGVPWSVAPRPYGRLLGLFLLIGPPLIVFLVMGLRLL